MLARMPDSGIDYSDIPPLGDDFWKNTVRNPFYKPTKQVTTVRVDYRYVARQTPLGWLERMFAIVLIAITKLIFGKE
ncbi:MAG: hypothetical protein NTZ64_07590 [Polaromonas sp.]|nr:hypothetical protein [Polaromonas sp.]